MEWWSIAAWAQPPEELDSIRLQWRRGRRETHGSRAASDERRRTKMLDRAGTDFRIVTRIFAFVELRRNWCPSAVRGPHLLATWAAAWASETASQSPACLPLPAEVLRSFGSRSRLLARRVHVHRRQLFDYRSISAIACARYQSLVLAEGSTVGSGVDRLSALSIVVPATDTRRVRRT